MRGICLLAPLHGQRVNSSSSQHHRGTQVLARRGTEGYGIRLFERDDIGVFSSFFLFLGRLGGGFVGGARAMVKGVSLSLNFGVQGWQWEKIVRCVLY